MMIGALDATVTILLCSLENNEVFKCYDIIVLA